MKRGFGTNFHSVYANNAHTYHEFSASEVFSQPLMDRMRELFVGEVMLDIACGTCHKTNLFSNYFKKVYALDLSKTLLQLGSDKYGKNAKINFLWASADNIPLLDNSVDTVIITWGSFPLTKTLKEINRVLKPGGVALRVGAFGLDDFTSLFPKFDQKRINRIRNTFYRFNYKAERHSVNIKFKNLDQAKKVLSVIVGAPTDSIKEKTIKHEIALYVYKKPK